ncbi:MAG: beta-N-acetylhexosaminidase [Rhodospirillaceae bacterium]|nr:beta-N-acetylhexosaminidase [Rhodospirillaceae bacterium]
MPVGATILGCASARLREAERRFFGRVNPLGFILFARNVKTPDQTRALVADLRDSVGRGDAPVLIDQEGGRVARLKPPHWYGAPPAGVFADLYASAPTRAVEAVRLNTQLIADDLVSLGIDVDCAPVLDVPVVGAHDVIGDRAYGDIPSRVEVLGTAVCDALLAAGVLPVIKHIPGHGRATTDSHLDLPVVETSRVTLEETDFVPFRTLAAMPWAMTAHVVYSAIDPTKPATFSPTVIRTVIRGQIGFQGLLLSDDLSMAALNGAFAARAQQCRAAGCDVALHCNGDMEEMKQVAEGAGAMDATGHKRVANGRKMMGSLEDFDRAAAMARLFDLLDGRFDVRRDTT